jgi:hypothetical protein
LFGNPVEKIIHVVNRMSPEMILATPHQYSRVAGILTRSVTRSLELVVRCPVLLVPESR